MSVKKFMIKTELINVLSLFILSDNQRCKAIRNTWITGVIVYLFNDLKKITKTEFARALDNYFKERTNQGFLRKGRSIDYDALYACIVKKFDKLEKLEKHIKRYGIRVPAKILQEEIVK